MLQIRLKHLRYANRYPLPHRFAAGVIAGIRQKVGNRSDLMVFGYADPQIVIHAKLQGLIHALHLLEYGFTYKSSWLANIAAFKQVLPRDREFWGIWEDADWLICFVCGMSITMHHAPFRVLQESLNSLPDRSRLIRII